MFRVHRGEVDLDRRVLRTAEGPVDLTPSEVAALRCLHAAAGRVVDREELLRVWGYSSSSRSQAIHVALRRLRAKLERDPAAPEHLRTVAGVGWVLEPLPPDAPGVVGRAALLHDLQGALDAAPLVALVGPGGIGKTTLARAALASRTGRFVDASAATDEGELDAAIARTLGVADPRAVAPRVGLLVLDNLEQLGGAEEGPVRAWIAAGGRALLTSRVRPDLDGARTLEVPPLDEAAGASLLAARSGVPAASLGPLVTALEGNPLCLELAAPRLRLLSPEALLARLSDRFAVLRTREPGLPARQSALDASIEASTRLLDDAARDALSALATLRAPFPPEAGEAVIGPGALDALDTLHAASLVGRDGDHLTVLASVREWCERHLPPTDAARDRHAAWFARRDPNRVQPPEAPDLVAALRHALADGPAAEVAHVLGALSLRCPVAGVLPLLEAAEARASGDGRVRLTRVRALHLARSARADEALALLAGLRPTDPLQRGLTRESHGVVLHRLGRWAEADVELAAAEAAFDEAGVPGNSITVGLNRGSVARALGRGDEARARYTAALEAARTLGDLRLVAGALTNLAAMEGDPARAAALHADAAALSERAGDRFAAASTRLNLAWMRLQAGAVAEARSLATRALEELGPLDLRARARGLAVLGLAALAERDAEAGRGLLLEALVDAERVGDPRLASEIRSRLGGLATG